MEFNQNLMYLHDTSPDEIYIYIKELKSGTASGSYGITSDELNLIKFEICVPLSHVINKSFSKRVFPRILKEAIIV